MEESFHHKAVEVFLKMPGEPAPSKRQSKRMLARVSICFCLNNDASPLANTHSHDPHRFQLC
eukprot:2863549-Amphidinium_carterae.1